jgi:hypothetical protein
VLFVVSLGSQRKLFGDGDGITERGLASFRGDLSGGLVGSGLGFLGGFSLSGLPEEVDSRATGLVVFFADVLGGDNFGRGQSGSGDDLHCPLGGSGGATRGIGDSRRCHGGRGI